MIVGVVGGGQLGRMLALAGRPLGLGFRFLDPNPDACARDVGELVVGAFDDAEALDRFADGLDIATFEFENARTEALEALSQRVRVAPAALSLRVGQDRLEEKRIFTAAGMRVADYAPVASLDGLRAAVEMIGLPGVLKTRRGGYDGRGQARLHTAADAPEAWEAIGRAEAVYERFVAFDREVSLVGVRAAGGETAFYPLVENVHERGVLATTRAPAPRVPDALQRDAQRHAADLMQRLGHVGALCVEYFEVGGALVANELAPRVHNSGHWTIEGAETSQFENHLRAILGWPLGSTAARGESLMVNILGEAPDPSRVLAVPGAHLHLYNKAARAGRKIGHVTLCASSAEELDARAASVRGLCARAAVSERIPGDFAT